MGNCNAKETTVAIDKTEIKTPFGSCGVEHCASSCCIGKPAEEQKKEHDLAEQAKEVERALRYARNCGDHELLKMIREIMGQTGSMPDVVFLGQNQKMPAVSKRTLTIRVHDLTPVE